MPKREGRQEKLFPSLVYGLWASNIYTRYYAGVGTVTAKALSCSSLVVLIYNEDDYETNDIIRNTIDDDVHHLMSMAGTSRDQIIWWHLPERVSFLGSKKTSHERYSRHNIPIPDAVTGHATAAVFSIADVGSRSDVNVLKAGDSIPSDQHNVDYIDTRVCYKGAWYYVCLRAFVVAGALVAVYVRAKPTSEGNPAVHVSTTPQDLGLLQFLYDDMVAARWAEIDALCASVEPLIGYGFYVHDILPCANSGDLFICESGIKLGNSGYRKRFHTFRSCYPVRHYVSLELGKKAASALAGSLRNDIPQSQRITLWCRAMSWLLMCQLFAGYGFNELKNRWRWR